MLQSASRTTPKRSDPVERAIIELARSHPEFGQARVAAELAARGLAISASGVRHIWQRHDLETAYKRIKALAGMSGRGSRLTERQTRLLERGAVGMRSERRHRLRQATNEATPVDRRMQILGAAADCFATDGYAGASLRDIGRKIGLLPGSIYHHFPTKDDLFFAVHEQGFVQLIDHVKAAIARGTDPWQRLEFACAEHIRGLVAGDTILRLTGSSFFSSLEPEMTGRLKPDRDRYEKIFKKLIVDLALPKGIDRTVFRLTLLGAINWTHVWYREGRYTPSAIAHLIVGMLAATRRSSG